jgi:redox-sensing transcriptional repressor
MLWSKPLISRLTRYLRVLRQLRSLGFAKVFSNNLGDAVGVSAAVVRKDFSAISIGGNKRGGYDIDYLIREITEILGKREPQEAVLVGCGRMGSAILQNKAIEKEDIRIVAGFDVEKEKVDHTAAVPIYHIAELKKIVRAQKVEVAVLTVPDENAQEVFERLLDAGVRGFLNFTSVPLKCPDAQLSDGCVVHHVNIGLELEILFYLVRAAKEGTLT